MNIKEDKNILNLEEINQVLSDTLFKLSERKISPRRAQSISRIALSLSKNITSIELKNRVEFLEQVLKDRK